MFPILGFPVNLTRNTNSGEDDDRKEVDFFSDRTKPSPSTANYDQQHFKPVALVKKEITPLDEKPPNSNIHVNTGLQLANTGGSDQSVIDDAVSSDSDDKRAKTTEVHIYKIRS